MRMRAVAISYAKSLAWIAMLIALALDVVAIGVMLNDFRHSLHGPQSDVPLMAIFVLAFWVIATIGSLIMFAPVQAFQVLVIGIMQREFGDRARFAALSSLPITAVLTWYCYDYLTPNEFHFGARIGLYQNGISIARYLAALAVQTPVTLFAFLYFEADRHRRSKAPILIAALAVAIAIGGGILIYIQPR
jgi:heme/copper-type cytochrome/quinol oxidase subunit 4